MDDPPKSDADHLRADIAAAEKALSEAEAKVRSTDALFCAIGKVAEAWASVELSIDHGSWRLAGVMNLPGACMTSQIGGSARKLDAFIALTRLRGGDSRLMKRINTFAQRARELQERRNRVVHDPWLLHEEGGPRRYEVSARRVVRMDIIPVSTADVLSLAQEIGSLWDDILDIRKTTDALASASLDTLA